VMETRMLMFPLLVPLTVFVVLVAVLFVAVIVSDRGGARPSRPHPPPAPPPPAVRREGRLSILQRLADRRITVEDAEQELLRLGDPVPATMPPPPPAPAPSRGRGCLLAALVFLVIGAVLLVLLLGMSWVRVGHVVHGPPHHIQRATMVVNDAPTRLQAPAPPQAEVAAHDMPDWQLIESPSNQEQP
jgi:hypothetical protein